MRLEGKGGGRYNSLIRMIYLCGFGGWHKGVDKGTMRRIIEQELGLTMKALSRADSDKGLQASVSRWTRGLVGPNGRAARVGTCHLSKKPTYLISYQNYEVLVFDCARGSSRHTAFSDPSMRADEFHAVRMEMQGSPRHSDNNTRTTALTSTQKWSSNSSHS